MPDLICPRCGSDQVLARVCSLCHISYDTDKAFQPRTREHTMLKARHANWTLEKRRASQSATERRLLGL